MNGITILNTIEVNQSFVLFVSVIVPLLIMCVGLKLLATGTESHGDNSITWARAGLAVMIIGLFSFIGTNNRMFNDYYKHTRYEVSVDKSADMVRFKTLYKTLDKRGDIYVVIERE